MTSSILLLNSFSDTLPEEYVIPGTLCTGKIRNSGWESCFISIAGITPDKFDVLKKTPEEREKEHLEGKTFCLYCIYRKARARNAAICVLLTAVDGL
jgi:hypothetical protein